MLNLLEFYRALYEVLYYAQIFCTFISEFSLIEFRIARIL
jgi:hypothetical protein